MTAEDTQNLLVSTLSKIAKKKEVDEKKEVMKVKDKKMNDKCDYAEKVAETLDYLHNTFDLTFGSNIQKAIKLASEKPVPNMNHQEASSGPAGRPINETRDSMAVGEEPSSNKGGLGTVAGVPNMVAGTLEKRPGGSPVDPSNPPLMNKSAYSKVLAKLAQNKVAGSEVPNQVRLMDATESGKGQSGYDSGSSHGNGNRSLVNTSNERAMSYTKADAKKSYNKEQMSQVFDEVHPEKDNALDRAFAHGVDTAKMAGVQEMVGRAGQLLAGGKKMPAMVGNRVKDLRPGNHLGQVTHAANGREALKSLAARGVAGAGLLGAGALGAKAMSKEAMGIESFNHESSLADTIDSMKDRTKVKHAGVEDAKKLKSMAKKEVKEEKAEEKLMPGIHKKIEKEASLVSKGAMLLRKLAEAVPTNMPPQAAAELPAQGGVPPEDAQEMGGQEDQIEKLKKLLLLMQMAKKQEEQQMMQGQSAMPDVASPGGASANEMAAATSGPAQGIM